MARWASVFTFEHGGIDNDFNVNSLVSTYKYAWHDFWALYTFDFFKFLEESGWIYAYIQRKIIKIGESK